MTLPIVSKEYLQERNGILAVASRLNKLGVIWRETPNADVGIDGQIELVNNLGQAMGQLFAVQVKAGDSYFRDAGNHWRYTPSEKHRHYWEGYPVPVLLFLWSPSRGLTYFTDARQWIRTKGATVPYVDIPKENILDHATVESLFATTGSTAEPFLDIPDVLNAMVKTRWNKPWFPLSFFDLFVHGLTNIVRSLFFDMSVVSELLHATVPEGQPISVTEAEQEFVFSYVKFLVQQNIASVDFSDCLIDYVEREMQPRFHAPLTRRGRELVRHISKLEDDFRSNERLSSKPFIRVAQESFVQLIVTPSFYARRIQTLDFQRVYQSGQSDI